MTAHLTPVHFIHTTPCIDLQWYRTAIGWPVNKGIYKYVQICTTRTKKREGNRNDPNGDLTKDVSTWSSTYIKPLTIKEKLQC